MRLVGLPNIPAHLEVSAISITGSTGFGANAYPQGWYQTSFNYKDVFSWIRSSHVIKTGAEIRRTRANSKNTSNYIPSFSLLNPAGLHLRRPAAGGSRVNLPSPPRVLDLPAECR